MGHPARATWLPTERLAALAPAVARIRATYGADPSELAALLTGEAPPGAQAGQLTALAWVLDPALAHVLLVHHRILGWSCPGGHVELGEEPAATATRELREETGLELMLGDPDPVTLSVEQLPADGRGPAHVHWNLGFRFTGDPAVAPRAERDAVGWHRVDDLPAGAVADLAPLLAALTSSARW